MIITLNQQEMQWASAYGQARTSENVNRSDINEYRQEAFTLTSLQNNKLAVCVEMAFVKWMGLPEEVLRNERPDIWAGYVREEDYSKYLGQPDILGVLECRKVNKKDNPVVLRSKDKRAGAIVASGFISYQRNGQHIIPSNEVHLMGWADSVADWATANKPWWGDGTSRVAAERKPMDTIRPEDIFERAGVKL